MTLAPDPTGPGFRLHHPHLGWLTEAVDTDFTWRHTGWSDAHVFPTAKAADKLGSTLAMFMAPERLPHLVAVVGPNRNARLWSVSRWPSCASGLRTGRCRLDEGHRGRCSTAVVYCDGCGYKRGNTLAHVMVDGNGDPDIGLCWFCVRVAGPEVERKAWEDFMEEQRSELGRVER